MQMSHDFKWNQVAYWEHYKGGRYVIVEDTPFAWLEEDYDKPDLSATMKGVVIYRSLDKPEDKPWARRSEYFYGGVEVNGEQVPRFRPVSWEEAYKRAYEGGEN